MKRFKLKIEEEWTPSPKSRRLKSRTVFNGKLDAHNLIALLREQFAFRYFDGRAPNMARLDFLDFDPKIDKALRLPSVSGKWCRFSFIPPNQSGKCVSVEAFQK